MPSASEALLGLVGVQRGLGRLEVVCTGRLLGQDRPPRFLFRTPGRGARARRAATEERLVPLLLLLALALELARREMRASQRGWQRFDRRFEGIGVAEV